VRSLFDSIFTLIGYGFVVVFCLGVLAAVGWGLWCVGSFLWYVVLRRSPAGPH
jgi:hypothetical protein